jgi:glucans biosynthesis protein
MFSGAAAAQEAPDLFTFDSVVERARIFSLMEESVPLEPLPEGAGELDYDGYRRMTFVRERQGLADNLRFRLQFAPRGFLFTEPILVNMVADGIVQRRDYSPDDFLFYDLPLSEEDKAAIGFSGVRVLTPLNQSGKFDEVVTFQGASFFRALGAGNAYGASARGLAVATASPEGEEFPAFREFWVEEPPLHAKRLKIFALMDSQSVTGAFAFEVRPGVETVIDVRAVFFPKRDIAKVGIAPLTSMFQFGDQDPLLDRRDFRHNVHDSDGLLIHLANGERVWRPVVNPQSLEISTFAEQTPRGFGLAQRERRFAAFQDLEARYERRPTVWITPKGDWGRGRLMLVEIPTPNEFNDNIVAFWRPEAPWPKGGRVEIAYEMRWGMAVSETPEVASVAKTRLGREIIGERPLFVIEFASGNPALFENAEPVVTASRGEVKNVVLSRNPETGGMRLSFALYYDDPAPAELRAVLMRAGEPVSETWLFRWTDL